MRMGTIFCHRIFFHVLFLLLVSPTALSKNYSDYPSLRNAQLKHSIKKSLDSNEENVCTTEGCQNAAAVIRDYMDETYDPCRNFYAFTCGGYFKKYENFSGNPQGIVWAFSEIKKRVFVDLKNLLEEEYNKTEPRIFSLVKTFYKTCLNFEHFTNEAENSLRNIINDLGGWPIVEGKNWNSKNFNWVDMDIKLRAMGFQPKNIFNIFVFHDLRNSIKNVLYVNPLTTAINTANMKEGRSNIEVGFYKVFMVDMAKYFGVDVQRARTEMEKVLQFELKLTKADSVKKGSPNINVTSIADLEEQLPSVPWEKYIKGLTEPVVYINRTDPIVRVKNPHYLSHVKKILENTDESTVANYMIWRTIAASAPYIGGRIREIYAKFKLNTGRIKLPDRWEECINILNDKTTGLTVGVSSMYIRKYFNRKSKKSVRPVLYSIIKHFQNTIKKSKWMDEISKAAAMRKSYFMKKIIAYPNQLLNDAEIDKYTHNIYFDEYRFFENALTLSRFHYDYALTGLQEKTDQRLWITLSDSTLPSAYYYILNNAFTILAGILQTPIFNFNWPNYAKFGSIGFIIGHEMMHAYDSKNILHDETGSFRPWVTPEVKQEYNRKLTCFVEQYEKYTVSSVGYHVDGKMTLNENLADNVGLKVSYKAYRDWEQSHPNEPSLPGLKYTPEQIFWMTSIHFLCNRNTEDYKVQALIGDPHTLNGFRATGTLSNLKHFSKAFNCPIGSPMNPEHKCKLW